MDLLINLKGPQNQRFRRNDSNMNILSGRDARINLNKAFQRYTNIPDFNSGDAARSRVPEPVNRYFGIFPQSNGTLLSKKPNIGLLAFTNPFGKDTNNVQTQNTEVVVHGANYAGQAEISVRFPNYKGNVNGGVSRIKHALDATKSSQGNYIHKQMKDLESNPVVIEVRNDRSYLDHFKR